MSTIRKNLKFDDEDDRAKLVLKFLSYIPRRQADFITDLIFCHLEKCGVADPTKLNKRVVESITRNVYRDAAEYGSKQSSELVALIDLMSKMMNQGQNMRDLNQNENAPEISQDSLDLLNVKKALAKTKSNTDIAGPVTEKLQNEKREIVENTDLQKATVKVLNAKKNSLQDDMPDEVLDDDQDEVPDDLNEYYDF